MKKKIIFMLILSAMFVCSCTNQKNDENREISSEIELGSTEQNLNQSNISELVIISVEPTQIIENEDINMGEKPVEDIDSATQIEQQKEQSNTEDISNELEISLANSNIEAKLLENLSVIVRNNSIYDIIAGEEYLLKKLNGNQWVDIPINIAWNDLGITIKAGSNYEFNYNLNLAGTFEKDVKYRISKKVYMNQKEYILSTDFTVN